MRILIMAFPMTMMQVRVINSIDTLDEIVEETQCWFSDLSLTCKKFIEKYEIDIIYVTGEPSSYINGFVEILIKNYPDIKVVVLPAE